MKHVGRNILNIIVVISLLNSITLFSQGIDAVPENKAVVYFVRHSDLGANINFNYFDGTKVIGTFNGPKYIRYECTPGVHLFWAYSGNNAFIEAEVEAGKIYCIEAVPKMSGMTATVKLQAVNPNNFNTLSKIIMLMNRQPAESFSIEELENETTNLKHLMEYGMNAYSADKAHGVAMKKLTKKMSIKTKAYQINGGPDRDMISPAPEGKAVVYFVRHSSFGAAINFSYFDGVKLIGSFNGPKYIRYECTPGVHLFWARSENKDFIEAEIEAGKIYFIEAIPKMGAVKAAVKLHVVNPKNLNDVNDIMTFLSSRSSESFSAVELEAETRSFEDVIKRGMDKYTVDKANGVNIKKLDKQMAIDTKAFVTDTQDMISPAPEGKAVVYFVRHSDLLPESSFSYFEGTKVMGTFSGPKYIRYECTPGVHLFWVHADNNAFIQAEVDAGKIYFIEVVPKTSGMIAEVKLQAIKPDNLKVNKIMELLNKQPSESFSAVELEAETKRLENVIAHGMNTYSADKANGATMKTLSKKMAIDTKVAQTNMVLSRTAPQFNASHFFEVGIAVSYFDKTKAPSNTPAISDSYKKTSRASLNFGYRFHWKINPVMSLVTGLTYAERGAGYRRENTDGVIVTTTYNSGSKTTESGKDYLRYRLSYIEIPLNVQLLLNPNQPTRHVAFVGGITPMFNVASKIRANYYVGSSNDVKEKWDVVDLPIAKKMIFALNLGLSISNKKCQVFVMYNKSLSNVYNTENGYNRFDRKMSSFTFGMAYNLRKYNR